MQKFVNFRPIIFVAVALIFGICATFYGFFFSRKITIILCAVFTILCVIYLLKTKGALSKIFISLCATMFLLGALFVSLRLNNFSDFASCKNEVMLVSGKVESVEEAFDKEGKVYQYNFVLDNVIIENNKNSAKIELCFDEKVAEVGDYIQARASLSSTIFDYQAKDNFVENFILSGEIVSNVEVIEGNPNLFNRINSKIISTLLKNMNESAPFCIAMLTGNDNFMPFDELQNYRYAGIAHIFAVSGLHIGFLAAVFEVIFRKIKFRRLLKSLIISFILLLYSGVCGFSPSSMRAVVMYFSMSMVSSIGRKYDFLSSIFFSMIIVLLINPFDLFNVGFVLSFGSVISISLFSKSFKSILPIRSNWLKESLALSLAVTFGIAPISCYYFEYFSLISVVLNIVIIPVCAIIFVLLAVSTFISMIIPIISQILIVPEFLTLTMRSVLGIINFERLIFKLKYPLFIVYCFYPFALMFSDKVNTPKKFKKLSLLFSTAYLVVFGL